MIDFIDAIILAFVQGVSELLPISSSGHLILAADLINLDPTVELLAFLHLASVLAIAFSYRGEFLQIVKSERWLEIGIKIVIAIIPVAIIGLLFEDDLEKSLYNPTFVGINLIIWGVVMVFIEWLERKKILREEVKEIESIGLKHALIIGLAQVLALLPGTSRSGVTTIAGMATGIKKRTALDFSFFIGIPSLAGAYLLASAKNGSIAPVEINSVNIVMLVATFIISYLSIALLKRFSEKQFLTFFGAYRILLGITILMLLL